MTRRAISEWAHSREGFSRALIARHALLQRPLPGAQLIDALGARGAEHVRNRLPASTLLRAAAMPAPVAAWRRPRSQPPTRVEARYTDDALAPVADDDHPLSALPEVPAAVATRPEPDALLEPPALDRAARKHEGVTDPSLPPETAGSHARLVARAATTMHVKPHTMSAPVARAARPAAAPATPAAQRTVGRPARAAERDAPSRALPAPLTVSSAPVGHKDPVLGLERGRSAENQTNRPSSPPVASASTSSAPHRQEEATRVVPAAGEQAARRPIMPSASLRPNAERSDAGPGAAADRPTERATSGETTTNRPVSNVGAPQSVVQPTSVGEHGTTPGAAASSGDHMPDEDGEQAIASTVRDQSPSRSQRPGRPLDATPTAAPVKPPSREASREAPPPAAPAPGVPLGRAARVSAARETTSAPTPEPSPIHRAASRSASPRHDASRDGAPGDEARPNDAAQPNDAARTPTAGVDDRSANAAPHPVPAARTIEERSARRRPTHAASPLSNERTDAGERSPRRASDGAQLDTPGVESTATTQSVSPLEWLKRLQAAAVAEASRSESPPAPEVRASARSSRASTEGTAPLTQRVAQPPTRASTTRAPAATAPPRAPIAAPARGRARPAVAGRVSPAPPPTSLRESTRAFLRPLVGIDPREVRIHEGDAAERIVSAHDADAITTGDEVLLAPGHDETSPEGLGLLAHELTHVARRHAPGYVPPIARGHLAQDVHSEPAADTTHAAGRPAGAPAPGDSASADGSDEEAVAVVAESLVRDAAPRRNAPPAGARPIEPRSSAVVTESSDADDEIASAAVPLTATRAAPARLPTTGLPAARAPAPAAPVPAAREAPARPTREREVWNGLPAPWDPMPAIVWDAPADRVAAAPPAPAGPVESPVADTPGGPGVRRAARGRAMEPSGDSEDGEGDDGNSGGAAPDVDAIARKVYDLLRRRLAAERRRGF